VGPPVAMRGWKQPTWRDSANNMAWMFDWNRTTVYFVVNTATQTGDVSGDWMLYNFYSVLWYNVERFVPVSAINLKLPDNVNRLLRETSKFFCFFQKWFQYYNKSRIVLVMRTRWFECFCAPLHCHQKYCHSKLFILPRLV
jgi:hypothetical protein